MAQDTRIGTTLAGYRIERLLGHGGMGRVYLAEDTRLGRKVALKLLDPELATDERFRDRFVRESRLAASLDHPNVVPIYEAGEHQGVLFIAMRFVEGTDLARLIEEHGPLGLERTSMILSQVAAALDAAHDLGLIHRDVKPGNILVGRGDHTYLTDFGLIKRREGETGLTRTGQFMGSVDYAAPDRRGGGQGHGEEAGRPVPERRGAGGGGAAGALGALGAGSNSSGSPPQVAANRMARRRAPGGRGRRRRGAHTDQGRCPSRRVALEHPNARGRTAPRELAGRDRRDHPAAGEDDPERRRDQGPGCGGGGRVGAAAGEGGRQLPRPPRRVHGTAPWPHRERLGVRCGGPRRVGHGL